MKRHNTVTTVLLTAGVALLTACGLLSQETPKASPSKVPEDVKAEYYKEWGSFQAMLSGFAQSLTPQQKAMQDQIRSQNDVVNKATEKLRHACGGNLNSQKLLQENTIECLPPTNAGAGEDSKKKKE